MLYYMSLPNCVSTSIDLIVTTDFIVTFPATFFGYKVVIYLHWGFKHVQLNVKILGFHQH